MSRGIVTLFLAAIVAMPVQADTGIGLFIANERYDSAPDARRSGALLQAAPSLEGVGFSVISGENLTAAQMRDAFATLLQGGEPFGAQRIVIALSGNFAHAGDDIWLMGRDAAEPGLARADAEGLRLGPLLRIAATAPGGALVVLAPNLRSVSPGAQLSSGLPSAIVVPQGVTLARGTADQAASFLRDVANEAAPLASIAQDYRLMRIEGFASPFVAFLPEDVRSADPLPMPVPDDERAEREAWRAAQQAGTQSAYVDYLDSYPNGRFATEAEAEIARIDTLPENRENALALNRQQRREIQQHLTLLGFSTRGIDGIFGPGTRTAIRGWQNRRGLAVTGFVDADQRALLAADATRRQSEINEEERREQAAQERADRAFWVDSGASAGDEAGLRAYLTRYPRGLFADVARARINVIEGERTQEQVRRDGAAWEEALAADTERAYRRYLATFPDGRFAARARTRITELTTPVPDPARPAPVSPAPADQATIASARDEEESLNLNFFVRNLIEAQLDALQFRPGRVDGVFDADFRRALRAYQGARGIPVTGYVTMPLLRRLISDGLPIEIE